MRAEPITTREFLAYICTIIDTRVEHLPTVVPVWLQVLSGGSLRCGHAADGQSSGEPHRPEWYVALRQAPLCSAHVDKVLVRWHTLPSDQLLSRGLNHVQGIRRQLHSRGRLKKVAHAARQSV